MDWPTATQLAVASALTALGALTVSVITLWKTHFAQFKPLCTVSDLGLRVFPIRSDKSRWYIPSFDVQVSVTNNGAKPGTVQGLRLALHYASLPIPNNREYVYARFEVDSAKFNKTDHDRFKWLDEVRLGHWMPFHVLPKQAVSKHLLFETRWDEPVVQDQIDCVLELQVAETGRWVPVARWTLHLGRAMWGVLLHRQKMAWPQADLQEMVHETVPPDLHKYTGTKEPLPKEPLMSGASYLDYPESNASSTGRNEQDAT